MKHLFAGLAALTLAACGNSGETAKAAEAGDGSAVCPASEVITDVAQYRNDHPAAQDNALVWHIENSKRDGVKTTESGLQYQIIKKGAANGPSPSGSQVIKVNYHGFFPDGKIFDSSYNRGTPTEFPANAVIKGWIEGLGLMKPCDAWTFYIPGNLAYGPRGRPGIPPNATLGFHVQLIEIK